MTFSSQELRLLWRRAAGNPGLTLLSLLTLAVAVGATVAIFTVVSAAVLQPLPFPDSERLVLLRPQPPKLGPLNHPLMSDALYSSTPSSASPRSATSCGNRPRCASRPSRSSTMPKPWDVRSSPTLWPKLTPVPCRRCYLGLEGSGVPVRVTEVEGRRGKQPDDSARPAWSSWPRCGRPIHATRRADPYATVGRSATTPRSRARPTPDTDPQPLAFAQRVHREAQQRGFDTADRQVVIDEGNAWTWNVAAEQFPGAVEIVDIYHAKQHLRDIAKAIYGPGAALANQWAGDRRAELDAGRLCAVVAALRIHVETTPDAKVHPLCTRELLPDALSAATHQGPVRLVGRRLAARGTRLSAA